MGAGSKALKGVLGDAFTNVTKNVGWGKGEYVEAAVKGALINAGFQGTTEWAQGGSFWSGAKSGLVGGAALGMGYRATKIGAMGSNYSTAKIGDVYDAYKSNYVSKQVQALDNMAKQTAKAKAANGLK